MFNMKHNKPLPPSCLYAAAVRPAACASGPNNVTFPPPIYWNKRAMLKLFRGDVHSTVICEIMCIEATM